MVMSTAHPGHSERKVQRKVVEGGKMSIVEITQPVAVEMYNCYMGGVDASDQYLSYHNTLPKTVTLLENPFLSPY